MRAWIKYYNKKIYDTIHSSELLCASRICCLAFRLERRINDLDRGFDRGSLNDEFVSADVDVPLLLPRSRPLIVLSFGLCVRRWPFDVETYADERRFKPLVPLPSSCPCGNILDSVTNDRNISFML